MNFNELDTFVKDLLHIDEATRNKLIDLEAGKAERTLYLEHPLHPDLYAYLIGLAASHHGKSVGNTVMRGSARSGSKEQALGGYNDVEWRDGKGERDAESLHRFIADVYREINLKGNNPLFLSVGALRWQIAVSQDKTKEVLTPVLLFPVRLIRSGDRNIPIYIEFVNDDVYVNPCLLAKLAQVWGSVVPEPFPLPDGCADEDDPVDLTRLGDGTSYFSRLEQYAARLTEGSPDTVFRIERNVAAIAEYRHDEICAYYDIRKNKEKIEASELVRRIFMETPPRKSEEGKPKLPACVLPRDSAQEDMISLAVKGENLIVKGPPGTGKTLTIANMIAALLAEGKRVVFSSKKLSALSEVYGKLPEKLRPFVMLLDGETEAETARADPVEIKREIKALLELRAKYVPSDDAIYGARYRAMKAQGEAVTLLTEYLEKIHGKDILGDSYYHALDLLCKYDIPAIALPETVCGYDASSYAAARAKVEEAGTLFDRLAVGKPRSVRKNPWYNETPLPEDGEEAFKEYRAIAAEAEEVLANVSSAFRARDASEEDAKIADLAALSSLPKEALIALAGEADLTYLKGLLLEETEACVLKGILPDDLDVYAIAGELEGCRADDSLDLQIADLVDKYKDILKRLSARETCAAFIDCMHSFFELIQKERALLAEADKVFALPLGSEQEKAVLRAEKRLRRYAGKTAVGIFDFGAKRHISRLGAFARFKDANFAEIVGAALAYADAYALRQEKMGAVRSALSRLLLCDVTDELAVCCEVLYIQGKEDPVSFARDALTVRDVLARASAPFGDKATLKELRAFYRNECRERKISSTLREIGASLGFTLPSYGRGEAEAVLAGYTFMHLPVLERLEPSARSEIAEHIDSAKIKALLHAFAEFGQKLFAGYYTCEHPAFTAGDLKDFLTLSSDRNAYSAARRYAALKEDEVLADFFRPLEENAAHACPFVDLFEHSVCRILTHRAAKDLGKLRYGMGDVVADALALWERGRKEGDEATLALIENTLMSSFDHKDPAFGFVEAQRGGGESLRKLFKQYSAPLLALKKCFILSPASVSVLFGKEAYSDFDVVIIDEASQLEPTSALPVFFRAKQCILVGDEYQMPPIKHFTANNEKRITAEGGDEIVYEADISVLTLALRNRSFPVRELKCHYRSRTESLIAFSQEKYYPAMRTFPATVPHSEGVGFRDVYVENGKCAKGVNRAEAEQVVRLLKAHFDRYFDGKQLKESVGVVAFGEAQIETIKSLVSADRALREKMNSALDAFDDLDEKLVFFKTIETVQGQETDHLILSLTYGRDKDGDLVQSFGQMNRGTLGQCIFNVAVTRARSTVTVVHSVLPGEIVNENVAYIGEYLGYSERFAREGLTQFVCEQPPLGFLRSVGEYLVSLGIARERIVYNYGVTKGSVRIPIAVLSENGREAQLGIWCETPVPARDFLDLNVLYFNSLKERGWQFVRLFAHDWVDNRQAEQEKLCRAVKKYVK